MTLPALVVTHEAIRHDPALAKGARGARKLLVTEMFETKERETTDCIWSAPRDDEKCQVQIIPDTEVAYFTHCAAQDHHYHKRGTEMYMVIEGAMMIEVRGVDYELHSGDMIVVNPGAPHRVKPDSQPFLCRVVTVHCGGASDKFPMDGVS